MAEIPKKITYVTLAEDEQIHPAYESALKRVCGELGQHHALHIGGSSVQGETGIHGIFTHRRGDPDWFLPVRGQ